MSKKKVWTAAAIRNLARSRLKAEEASQNDSPSAEPLRAPESRMDVANRAQEFVQERAREAAESANDSRLEWMWGRFEKSSGKRVVLAVPAEDADGGEEMRLLCETLGLDVVDIIYFALRSKPSSATYVGEGTVRKFADRLRDANGAALVMDAPLSPVQIRNIQDIMKAAVVDRQGVILAIFDLHAKTKLAKMQVELARLKYLQPRLSSLWMGLSRQSGGKGGLGGRGLGETRLELDRRVVKNRISILTRKLKEAEKAFNVQAARRSELPRVALVGYTNAGKSTLMRALTKTEVEVEDKLFSTLDTTVRHLVPPTVPRILLSDTVGFVRDLPHDLVASFRSTLREALDSQLILHVVDISHPLWREHVRTTDEVLAEIGAADIPRVLVLNKMDAVSDSLRLRLSDVTRFLMDKPAYKKRLMVSALTGEGLEPLREELIHHFGVETPQWSQART